MPEPNELPNELPKRARRDVLTKVTLRLLTRGATPKPVKITKSSHKPVFLSQPDVAMLKAMGISITGLLRPQPRRRYVVNGQKKCLCENSHKYWMNRHGQICFRCANCDLDEILLWLRTKLPVIQDGETIEAWTKRWKITPPSRMSPKLSASYAAASWRERRNL